MSISLADKLVTIIREEQVQDPDTCELECVETTLYTGVKSCAYRVKNKLDITQKERLADGTSWKIAICYPEIPQVHWIKDCDMLYLSDKFGNDMWKYVIDKIDPKCWPCNSFHVELLVSTCS